MAILPPLSDSEIPSELLEELQFFKGPLGVIPNSVRTMARRPEIVRAFTQLNIAVMQCHAGVTSEFKRLLAYVSSFTSGCRYCQAHTILAADRFGASAERIASVWNFADSPHFSAREKAALRFARAASAVPNEVTAELEQDLKQHWGEGEIVEIMGVIALFGYLNRWNDSMGSALEDLPIEAAEKFLQADGWEAGKHG